MSAYRLVQFVFFRMEGDGMSRKEMAAKVYITETTLSNFATGYREPKLATLEKMLKVVGYDLCAVPREAREKSNV